MVNLLSNLSDGACERNEGLAQGTDILRPHGVTRSSRTTENALCGKVGFTRWLGGGDKSKPKTSKVIKV